MGNNTSPLELLAAFVASACIGAGLVLGAQAWKRNIVATQVQPNVKPTI